MVNVAINPVFLRDTVSITTPVVLLLFMAVPGVVAASITNTNKKD